MTFLRDMKETLTNGVKDMTKLTKLTAEDTAEEMKHKVRQGQINNTLDNLHDGYEKMKESVKDALK